jgi:hypothetical protein
MDVRKMYSDNVTPDRMLDNLRNETRRNRELCYDILPFDFFFHLDVNFRALNIEHMLQTLHLPRCLPKIHT